MKNLSFKLLIVILLTVTSCSRPVDIEAEKQAIKEMVKMGFETEKKKDVDAVMNLEYFTDDVIVHGSNMPQIQGLEAVRNFYTEFFKILISIEGGSTETFISESGDMAWDYGWNHAVYKGPDGPIDEKGKYLQVLKKINGKWKCVSVCFTSDAPIK